jgi:hypothetical protein
MHLRQLINDDNLSPVISQPSKLWLQIRHLDRFQSNTMDSEIFAEVIMKFRHQLIALSVLLLSPSALAQGEARDQKTVDGIASLANAPTDTRTAQAGNKLDFSITSTRGGSNSKRPLGLYGLSHDVEFRSDYKKLTAREQSEWAYDLWQYVLSSGGGIENYKRYLKETPPTSAPPILNSSKPDPMNRSYIPYKQISKFTEQYWDKRSPAFKKLTGIPRSWFVNDAILDGSNLYLNYQMRLGGHKDSAFVLYKDFTLDKLQKRQ